MKQVDEHEHKNTRTATIGILLKVKARCLKPPADLFAASCL